MDNRIKIGDKVKFLDSKGGGEVISILDNLYIILTIEGFEEKHSINAIIKVNEDLEKSLKTTYVPDGFKKLTKKVQKHSIFKSKTPLVWEIDIHIENLIDNFYHMSNYEIVNYQLDKCENIIHKALKAKVHKLVIIHGKGQGVLRKEVHNLLYSIRLDFKDSDYIKYSGGATDVFFR
jgi:dsDNA-specific endonuclease/ATPase MutS2